MERKDYTLEVWKYDRRYKDGGVLLNKYEYRNQTLKWMREEVADLQAGLYPPSKYSLVIKQTYVERTNAMTGEKFMERYDTPWSCSPASETYWSA